METLPPDFRNRLTLNVAGSLMDISSPKIMGILNITPDSFFDGGKHGNEAQWLSQAEKMLDQGADIIDVGGYSSRPGARDIPADEEAARALPAIASLKREFPDAVISIDTFRSAVARNAVDAGASMVNDISAGLLDGAMLPVIAALQVPYIMMHMRGTPQTMSGLTGYDDVVRDVMFYFSQRIAAARNLGINDIVIDPGFGFAKTTEQNYALLQSLERFTQTGLPVLAGLSRKSMATRLMDIKPDQAVNATTSLNTIALIKGAKILRVHDVKEAVEVVRIYNALNR